VIRALGRAIRYRRAGLTVKHAVQLAALQYEIFKLQRNMR
jgi:hypothetical protein